MLRILQESTDVKYKRNKDSSHFESWLTIIDNRVVGEIFRPSQSKTSVYANINGKNIYPNGFNSVNTAKGYVKSFIRNYI